MARRGYVARPYRRPIVARRRIGPRWGIGGLALLALCAAAAWLAARAIDGGSGPAALPTATAGIVAAQPTPEPPELVAATEDRHLPSTSGSPVAIRDFRGRPLVLAFYAEST